MPSIFCNLAEIRAFFDALLGFAALRVRVRGARRTSEDTVSRCVTRNLHRVLLIAKIKISRYCRTIDFSKITFANSITVPLSRSEAQRAIADNKVCPTATVLPS